MGNCQAIDNAALMIQQPGGGRVEKMYWPVAASEIMKTNPGHYVALLLTTTTLYNPHSSSSTAPAPTTKPANASSTAPVRVTRIKLLRPTDTLILGQVYRLISNEEVMKGLWAKKYAKMKKKETESGEQREEMIKEKLGCEFDVSAGRIRSSGDQKTDQVMKHDERRHHHHRHNKQSSAGAKPSRTWQPSLRSISESTS
ncbi:uncharacterized protein LOC124920353 [Impatiens glandulifera]|uniref:uncharacterized protein LOC124920353 n=1 Tax=Impatiens glandulifera TaxID=253017 RepID=UPI001FB0CC5E|nr:uncharacterized protein LOC124920353 [Impatiens glandulifera]